MASVLPRRPYAGVRWACAGGLLLACAAFFGYVLVGMAQSPRTVTSGRPAKDAPEPARPSEPKGFLELEEPTRIINSYFARIWKAQGWNRPAVATTTNSSAGRPSI